MSFTEEQIRAIILDDIVKGKSGESVLQVSRDVANEAGRSFIEQARVITEQRTALEGVFANMQKMHDSFETKTGEAKAEMGTEVLALQTQMQAIIKKVTEQITQSEEQDGLIKNAQNKADALKSWADTREEAFTAFAKEREGEFDIRLKEAEKGFREQLQRMEDSRAVTRLQIIKSTEAR